MRFTGGDGSCADLVMLVPPFGAVSRKLRVTHLVAWHAPSATWIGDSDDPDLQRKMVFLLLTMINTCREAVLDTLGPAAHGAEWWTDVGI